VSHILKDTEHLLRMAGLFALGVLAFVVLRAVFVPVGFGELGHYRSGALADNRAHPMVFAGRDACADCHDDVVAMRKGGAHVGIGCEACHGALAAHAENPETAKAKRPDPRVTCLICHRPNVAKRAGFPQVEPSEHGEGQTCTSCHRAHNPKVQ
jgi:hypothetical protein